MQHKLMQLPSHLLLAPVITLHGSNILTHFLTLPQRLFLLRFALSLSLLPPVEVTLGTSGMDLFKGVGLGSSLYLKCSY